jgi:hypothetical protein
VENSLTSMSCAVTCLRAQRLVLRERSDEVGVLRGEESVEYIVKMLMVLV